jgi:hypothetical protein
MAIKQIRTQDDLVALSNELRMRRDWHEPDERGVSARVTGSEFDNAGTWGAAEIEARRQRRAAGTGGFGVLELFVTLYHEGEPVAEVNLATLFAFATGWPGE